MVIGDVEERLGAEIGHLSGCFGLPKRAGPSVSEQPYSGDSDHNSAGIDTRLTDVRIGYRRV